MATFHIPAKALKALGYLAPRKDVREYLRGIHLDRSEDGRLVLAATTGSIFGALKLHEVPPFDHYTASISAVDAALKIASTGLIEVTPERVGAVSYQPVPGQFPTWRRIVPAAITEEPANYDADLLGQFAKAAKAMGYKSGHFDLYQNGQGGARVAFLNDPDFLGVIMPLRPPAKYERGPAPRF